ncbi:MAG: phosphodiester glycosidase family protein [Actinomycetota bacterium]|nr:phosphodiester glycosidase family protein [Actinomycetota bacterium]
MGRIALIAAILAMVPVLVSYAQALAQPSNSSVGIRTVEWMRDNGARGLVTKVESLYYSLSAPSKGGPALRSLPGQPGIVPSSAAGRTAAGHAVHVHYYRPRAITPVIQPALAGEGAWRATFADGGARPPVLVASFRPDPAYPQTVAGVAWIDHTRTSTWLYPGRLEPAVTLSRGPMEVPPRLRSNLVATFNSGFKLSDSGGGFAVGGHAYAPLRRGLATILRYRDGKVNVVDWTGGSDVGPYIIYARQNLPLIVDNGQPNPNLSSGPQWGATLGNAVRVWRSAVGKDRHGNLIYAAADNQTVGSIAAIMIRAGAVRAMELDINSYWTSFITYRHGGAVGAANLLATMSRSPQRYLTPDDRDFFAVYAR